MKGLLGLSFYAKSHTRFLGLELVDKNNLETYSFVVEIANYVIQYMSFVSFCKSLTLT